MNKIMRSDVASHPSNSNNLAFSKTKLGLQVKKEGECCLGTTEDIIRNCGWKSVISVSS